MLDHFSFKNRELGQDVLLSDVISTIHRVLIRSMLKASSAS
jgi:hypothetical protein